MRNQLVHFSRLVSKWAVVVIIGFAPLPLTLAGVPWEQTYKLLASDGDAGDELGRSVSISGNTAIIGAPGDGDINHQSSGSAYVFDVSSGQQLFKLLATDGTAIDEFGASVSVSGNLAVIGAPGDDPKGSFSGSAYIFDVTTGQQLRKLNAVDGTVNDSFGVSVSISGSIAVIGASGDDVNGIRSGSAYVFDVTTGRQLFKLLPSGGASEDEFGISVSVSGNKAVVGTKLDQSETVPGAAYVFDVTTGEQLHKLHPTHGFLGDEFGSSVAISGNMAVVGAWATDLPNGLDSGEAYIFDVSTGQQLHELVAPDGSDLDAFGFSVAISDNIAVITAIGDDDNGNESGSAYVFDVSTGEMLYKLLTSYGAAGDQMGNAVDASDNVALIGDYSDDDNGFLAGTTYIFAARTINYLSISPMPIIAGQNGTFSIVETLPNMNTWLLYSLNGLGQTFIPQLNVMVDLNKPKMAIGPKMTDANGGLQLVLPMPNVQLPINLWFQTVQQQNATNFVRTQLIP